MIFAYERLCERRTPMIEILIADDHAVVREGLKQIISETNDMTIAGEAVDGHEALNKALSNDYDVVVLDITLPGINGLDVLKQIKALKPRLPILVLSVHSEEQYAVRVLKAGAAGYLTKESASQELVQAIRTASAGRNYITTSLGEKLASSLGNDTKQLPHELLSDREYQVMCMISSGKSLREISERLFLSPKTVSTYRARILEKMNMKSTNEIILYALQHNLLE
jgi:two-component system invasion response regulator UvrY